MKSSQVKLTHLEGDSNQVKSSQVNSFLFKQGSSISHRLVSKEALCKIKI